MSWTRTSKVAPSLLSQVGRSCFVPTVTKLSSPVEPPPVCTALPIARFSTDCETAPPLGKQTSYTPAAVRRASGGFPGCS